MKKKLQITVSFGIFILIISFFFSFQNCLALFYPNNKELANPTSNEDDYNIAWYHSVSPAYGIDIIIDSTNKIYSVGYKSTGDYLIIQKFSSSGNLEWKITRGEEDTNPTAITRDEKNNLYITGRIGIIREDAELFIMKYNPDGDCLNFIKMEEYDCGTSIIFYQDYIYVTGINYLESGYQFILLKLDDNLNLQWQVIYDGNKTFIANDIKIDNFIYITGSFARTDLNLTAHDTILIKLDLDGNQIWNKTWGDTRYDYGRSLALSQDSIFLVGTSYSSSHNGFLLMYDHNGTLKWEQVGNSNYEWNDLVVINETEILVGGQYYIGSTVQTVLISFNSIGDQQWTKYWGQGGEDNWNSIKSMACDSSFNIYAVGLSNILDGVRGILTLKYGFMMESAPESPQKFLFIPLFAFTFSIILTLGTIISLIILCQNHVFRKKRGINNRQPYTYSDKISTKSIRMGERGLLKCPYCSYDLEGNGDYCPQCGRRL